MPEHAATIRWSRTESGPDFLRGRYSREHTWEFDGGATLRASPSPSIVPAPWSNEALVDPEEAYVAAIASCHFLTFAWVASKAGFELEHYEDRASGRMTKNERGAAWVSEVTLSVRCGYSGGKAPTREEEEKLHHEAHEQCFIANSVRTDVKVTFR